MQNLKKLLKHFSKRFFHLVLRECKKTIEKTHKNVEIENLLRVQR